MKNEGQMPEFLGTFIVGVKNRKCGLQCAGSMPHTCGEKSFEKMHAL